MPHPVFTDDYIRKMCPENHPFSLKELSMYRDTKTPKYLEKKPGIKYVPMPVRPPVTKSALARRMVPLGNNEGLQSAHKAIEKLLKEGGGAEEEKDEVDGMPSEVSNEGGGAVENAGEETVETEVKEDSILDGNVSEEMLRSYLDNHYKTAVATAAKDKTAAAKKDDDNVQDIFVEDVQTYSDLTQQAREEEVKQKKTRKSRDQKVALEYFGKHRVNPTNEPARKRLMVPHTTTRQGNTYPYRSLQKANPKGEDVVVPEKPKKRINDMSDIKGNSGLGSGGMGLGMGLG